MADDQREFYRLVNELLERYSYERPELDPTELEAEAIADADMIVRQHADRH